MVLESFGKARQSSSASIKKEIIFNLSGKLLTLYIRGNTFSLVQGEVQAFRIRNSKTKPRSLRAVMNQFTSFSL